MVKITEELKRDFITFMNMPQEEESSNLEDLGFASGLVRLGCLEAGNEGKTLAGRSEYCNLAIQLDLDEQSKIQTVYIRMIEAMFNHIFPPAASVSPARRSGPVY